MKTKLVNKDIRNNYTNELLMERGLNEEELEYFLNVPDDSALQSPDNLNNIIHGAIELNSDIKKNRNIMIIVDSDVDGFTSAAIISLYIRHMNPDITLGHVLHKGKGHGLSDTIESIINSDTKWDVVILPDSSTNDKEYHDQLKEYGAWCLVLDHHLSESDDYSDNAIIINNQLSDNYVNKDLSGAGVTWQFCRQLDLINNDNYANELIDLAALGIVSDMMSMLSLENRYIVHTGFSHIKNYYFQALCEKQSYSMGDKITPITVAFYITPLINAMIRTGADDEKLRCFEAFIDGHKMVECHKRGAKGTFEELAIESTRECVNARAKQNRILDKAEESLEIKIHKYNLLENKILFIRLEDEDQFPPELNGLVAMRLSAKYKRPTIVARLNDEGEIKGSGRGLNESELSSFKDFLSDSGYVTFTAGHDNAFGTGILDKNLAAFHDYANEKLANIDFGEDWYEVNFERIAADKDIQDIIVNISEHEDLWGQGNPEPLIHIKDINITKSDVRIMGSRQDTIKIEKFGIAYMKFHAKDMIQELAQYDSVKLEVVGRANLNEWGGYQTPQIFITNYQIEDNKLGF